MISYRDTALALYGSYRLLRLDPTGLSYFDRTRRGFWLSFYGPAMVLPVSLVYDLLVRNPDSSRTGGMDTGDYVILQVGSYILMVLAYTLLVNYLARAIGKPQNYIQFIVAYNWTSVVQAAIFFPIALTVAVAFPGSDFFNFLVVLVLMACVAYAWYVIRAALTENGWMAGAFLIFEVMLNLLVEDLVMVLY